LTDDLLIESGATLTINSGVEVNTESSAHDISIEGKISANGVSFTGGGTDIQVDEGGRFDLANSTVVGREVVFRQASKGTVRNTTFTQSGSRPILTIYTSHFDFVLSGNTFVGPNPVKASPWSIPKLYDNGNSFATANTIVDIGFAALTVRSLQEHVIWKIMPNVAHYNGLNSFSIESNASLTIQDGVVVNDLEISGVEGSLTVSGASFIGNDTDLVVGENGRFDLSDSTFAGGEVTFRQASKGDVRNNSFSQSHNDAMLNIYTSNIDFELSDNSFDGTNPVEASPWAVPKLYDNGNSFTNPSTVIDIGFAALTVRSLDEHVTWKTMPNLAHYNGLNNFSIAENASLTIQNGVSVNDLEISGVEGSLTATGVSFIGNDTDIWIDDAGRFDLSSSTFAGGEVTYRPTSKGDVVNNSFTQSGNDAILKIYTSHVDFVLRGNNFVGNNPVEASPWGISKLYDNGNTFASSSTVVDIGFASLTVRTLMEHAIWKTMPNVAYYNSLNSFSIAEDASLTILAGVVVNGLDVSRVNGTLSATGVEFIGNGTEILVDDGGRFDINGSTIAGRRLTYTADSLGVIGCSEFSLEMRADGESDLTVVSNDFSEATVRTTGNSSAQLDFTAQYWGSTNSAEIGARITDGLDDSNLPLLVVSQPLASSPLPCRLSIPLPIFVSGNGLDVNDGDSTPTPTDGTSFGSVVQGDAGIVHTFFVRNDGLTTITLSNLILPAGFTVVEGLRETIIPGAADMFTVQLDSTTIGSKGGQIAFTANGSASPFSFAVTGEVSAPDIPPSVQTVLINTALTDPDNLAKGVAPTTWQIQRSSIESITVHFSENVNATVDDFTLTNLGVNAPVDSDREFSLQPKHFSLSGSVAALRFAPAELADGVYQLSLSDDIANVGGKSLDGDGNGTAGGDYLFTGSEDNQFYVLAGEWSGDDGVSVFDFGTFSYWFGWATNVAPTYVDLNHDGGVSVFDFSGYSDNFGVGVEYPTAFVRAPFHQQRRVLRTVGGGAERSAVQNLPLQPRISSRKDWSRLQRVGTERRDPLDRLLADFVDVVFAEFTAEILESPGQS